MACLTDAMEEEKEVEVDDVGKDTLMEEIHTMIFPFFGLPASNSTAN